MASKSTIPGVRFVRCPRCRKVLAEIASVPVYQCGECGATLRAKHYSSTNQNSNATAPEITVSASSGAHSSAYLDPQLSKAADASSRFLNKGNEIEHEEGCLKERRMELEDSFFNARGTDFQSSSPTPVDVRNDRSSDNKENDNFCKARGMDLHSSISIPADVTNVGSLEDKEKTSNHYDECGNVSKMPIANAFDANLSSVSDRSNIDTPRKRVPMSRRTFRQRNVQDSEDTNAHKEESVEKIQVVTQIQTQEVSQVPSIEKPAAFDTFGSHANESSPKEKGDLVINPSFDSEDFHSVQNWKEPENHVHSNLVEVPKGSADNQNGSMAVDADSFDISRAAEVPKFSVNIQPGSKEAGLNSLAHIQMKILKKVDGLREEIKEIFDISDESKAQRRLRDIQEEDHAKHVKSGLHQAPPKNSHQRKAIPRPPRANGIPSQLYQVPHKNFHHGGRQGFVNLPSQSHCHNGICRACHHDHPCYATVHAGSSPPPCSHKSQVAREAEKPNNNDGRQQKKQLCRPVLGGSPFVTCYNCFELLRLPMDFFIVWRRSYKLQCGACSKVLTFSFRAPKHGIPHLYDEAETPTTELDTSTDTTSRHEISNFPSNDRSPREPVSYSEDYGYSLGISYSADTEMPVNILGRSTLMHNRKSRLKTGSQLHQLMGYGSASEILYRHSDNDEVSEFTELGTPHCNTPEERFVEDGVIRKGSYISDPSTSQHF
ncbi:protein ENHANCED DISEASE RESISTANCE 4-like [Zingiber officinale]|uniref:Zinc-ribbon domain-containing protein n=1 Tax=Zingiber officinale TaxID=94328 RepID=A0A8J5FU17_ZINOF|nr:protein ENHANCED DISEASE RESISTANCE 4-like [Zingiber officinale]KAG6490850.1 hypothetical protein ZIOFF_052174 [Zingiber officinale]